jgi:uncharacterized OB-fold protein
MDALAPERTPLNEPYWAGLGAGHLQFQHCQSCGHAWLPPRAECPKCLKAEWVWEKASGRGRLITWAIYHIAYHKAFASLLPYNVAVVELAEGPRLVTNIINPDSGNGLACDHPVELAIEQGNGVALAKFRLV